MKLKSSKQNFKQGFTLLELLVVVLIIGILAGIALPQYKYAVLKSKYNMLKIPAKALFEAESRYYLVNNVYTDDLTVLDVEIPNSDVRCGVQVDDNDITCRYISDGKFIFFYIIKIGGNFGNAGTHRRCFAFSTDQNDVLNKVCKNETGHEPYNNCKNYCAYKYEE